MSNISQANYMLIGYGYWGPNIARNIISNKNSNLKILIDKDNSTLFKAKKNKIAEFYFDSVKKIKKELIEQIDVIVIATPAITHLEILKSTAKFKKIYLITKPIVTSRGEVKVVDSLIKKYNLEIFVDETFIYSNKIKNIKDIVNKKSFGKLQYIYSNRSNLGRIQTEQNVIWDLAPHDLSIASFITTKFPTNCIAVASNPLNSISSKESIATVVFDYSNEFKMYLNVSWLSPEKLRYMVFSGTKQTLIFDDTKYNDAITLYNQSIKYENGKFNYFKSKGLKVPFEENEPLFDEIKQISNYFLTKKNKPVAGYESSIKNIFILDEMKYATI